MMLSTHYFTIQVLSQIIEIGKVARMQQLLTDNQSFQEHI